MARIRSVKPEFWTSEQIAECSPNARLTFIGLWNFCDDYGVHPANEIRLKMELFPSDAFSKAEIRALVEELITNSLVEEYEIDGVKYWYVTGWDRHQKPDTKTGKYPRPDGSVGKKIRRNNAEDSANDSRTDDERSHTEKEKEKEKELKPSCSTGERLNEGFEQFWTAYPKKQAKQDAAKAFRSAKLKPGELQTVLQDISSRKSSTEWLKDGGKFIPMPATYLRGKRWEDEQVTTAIHVEERKLKPGMQYSPRLGAYV